MAKLRLELEDLTVESFEVSGALGRGTVLGHSALPIDEGVDGPAETYSCNGSCQSCATQPCDPMCTGPRTCMCDLIGDDPAAANNFGL